MDATGLLLQRQGFHATGLSDIVAESGAPRGSLYFHSLPQAAKDELARAAIGASGAEWRARIEAAVAAAPDLDGAIGAVIELLAADLVASKFRNGCPVAAVALESPSEPVRKVIAAHFAHWEHAIAAQLVANGLAPAPAKQLATLALSAIEGALLLARVQRSTAPLLAVGQTLRGMIALAMRPRAWGRRHDLARTGMPRVICVTQMLLRRRSP